MDQTFAVYWRSAPRQLFSFRQSIQASSPREARKRLRLAMPRQRPILIGVKRLAPCGRRCIHGGQWVG